ncbi:hypothetical protein NJ76_00065, partial [Rhodococcus sp. IITR03]
MTIAPCGTATPFGPPGGPGREDDVGGVRRPQRRRPLGVDDRPGRRRGQVEGVDEQARDGPLPRYAESVAFGAQHHHGRGDVEDVPVAIVGLIRIDRHVGTTGRDDRVHTDEQIQRAAHRQTHRRRRTDTERDQVSRKTVHALREITVGQRLALELYRPRIRRPPDLLGEQIHEGRGVVERAVGVVPLLEDLHAFGVVEQVDITDSDGEITGDRIEEMDEALGDALDGAGVEQIGGVGQAHRVLGGTGRGRRLGDDELEVELGGRDVEVDGLDGQPRKFERAGLEVLERQHHLEQRVTCGGALGVEHLHESFERQVGVAERLEVGAAHPAEHLLERLAALDPGAQHEGVDEHAHQVVERR